MLRVLAILRVSVFHMFPFVILELAFPSMGVMFALAGSLMANSLARQPNPLKVIRGRVRRLLPALWVLGAVVVPAMFLVGWEQKPPLWHLISWLVPFADPPSSTWGLQAAEVLWYLVTYLWLVMLSPVLLWLYKRARLATVLLPIAAMAALTVWPIWPADAIEEVVTDVLVFAACWIIGFAHRDGTLRRIPAMVVVPLAAACVAGSVYWSHTHPDAGGLKYIPVAYAIYNIGFVLALLRWSPSMNWLGRRPGLTKWVSLINARAVTIYLWNNVAIALCYPVGDALEVWRLGKYFEVGYVLIALGLLCNAVLIFGWVEDIAARRKPRFLPWPSPAAATRPATPPVSPAAMPAPAMADTAELVGATAGGAFARDPSGAVLAGGPFGAGVRTGGAVSSGPSGRGIRTPEGVPVVRGPLSTMRDRRPGAGRGVGMNPGAGRGAVGNTAWGSAPNASPPGPGATGRAGMPWDQPRHRSGGEEATEQFPAPPAPNGRPRNSHRRPPAGPE
ncbi:acyltransferase family protein [Actinoplanes sp. NPDC026619]|uniref:acyltransferase family protein n=1 Tax=Actinoplanes sp. NPDC026619 TaxID=3155798 RepID=UPI0033C351F3